MASNVGGKKCDHGLTGWIHLKYAWLIVFCVCPLPVFALPYPYTMFDARFLSTISWMERALLDSFFTENLLRASYVGSRPEPDVI